VTTAAERVFIDASVFIAAAGSASGGSALVLDICQGRRYAAVCSQRVLLEAQTNIRDKLPPAALARFYKLLAALSPALVPPATEDEIARWAQFVAAKDAHVVASAVQGAAAYLITLDRKHLANEVVRAAGLPFQIMTPGDFLQQVIHSTRQT
jgi:predicted nucleic acid-binding protein